MYDKVLKLTCLSAAGTEAISIVGCSIGTVMLLARKQITCGLSTARQASVVEWARGSERASAATGKHQGVGDT